MIRTNFPLRRLAALSFAAAIAAAAGCASLPPNKPGPGDHHEFIAGIEAQTPAKVTANEGLARLRAGNANFAAGKSAGPGATASRSLATVKQTGAEGQKPFAAVLTCADSRTPPELIFDQGVGDLFVVRVAGNVTDVMGLASLEYAEDHLGVPLIVVLGHSRCGAVDAAVTASDPPSAHDAHGAHGAPAGHGDAHADDHFVPGNLAQLVDAIEPAVAKARQTGATPLLPSAIRANVRQTIAQISARSPLLAREIAAGDAVVIGAIYNVEDGTIEWLTN